MTTQRVGKYACLEIERKYLLKNIPEDLLENTNGWLITDRYFPNTRLRLRSMKSLSHHENIYKLTQKYRSETQSAYETTITNIYLTKVEYNHLESVEGRSITKKRYPYRVGNHNFSIDVFEGRHHGLILAETEFETKTEMEGFVLPLFALEEVTDHPFFSGGNLAVMTEEEFVQGLSQHLRGS